MHSEQRKERYVERNRRDRIHGLDWWYAEAGHVHHREVRQRCDEEKRSGRAEETREARG